MLRPAARGARVLTVALALPVLSLSTGCAAANKAWRSGPAGIAAEWAIRDHLSYGRSEQAWTALGDKKLAPSDALLRHMYRGVIALHAGEYGAGSRAMDRAWTIVDDRFTRRVSTAAASMLTSDATLPYYPGRTEWLFIPYYGALNWLARNELDATAVEARRMAQLLARDDLPALPLETQGVLRYVNGVLFEAAGERQDAMVAYRNAAAILGALPADTSAAPAGSGDVVVLIEEGFVGRPEPRGFGVYMNGDELVALTTGSDASRLAAARTVERRSFDPEFTRSGPRVGFLQYEVNWAAFGSPARTVGVLGARTVPEAAPRELGTIAAERFNAVAGAAAPAFALLTASVTDAVQADFEREQPARLARAIARTAVRWAAMEAAEKAFEQAADDRKEKKEKGEKGGGWGSIVLGVILAATSVTSSAIDQPDLRAWQLLPDRLTVARVRLPVGEHAIELTRGDEIVSLGTVSVRDGGVAVLTHRWWPGPGARPRAPTAF